MILNLILSQIKGEYLFNYSEYTLCVGGESKRGWNDVLMQLVCLILLCSILFLVLQSIFAPKRVDFVH